MNPASPYSPLLHAALHTCRRAGAIFGHVEDGDILNDLWILDKSARASHDPTRSNYERYFLSLAVRRCYNISLRSLGLRQPSRKTKATGKTPRACPMPERVYETSDTPEVPRLDSLRPSQRWSLFSEARGIKPRHEAIAMGYTPHTASLYRREAATRIKAGLGDAA